MPTIESGGLTINYIDEGQGQPIVLVHGFASSLQGNWRATGVVDALVKDGRRVVALDCRGHGRSDKPHDPEAYGGTKMADDVINLCDHLQLRKPDLMGYSMGGGIAASLLARFPERWRSVILAGVGDALVLGGRPPSRAAAIADALESSDPNAGANATARGFREFAERSGNDLQALGAVMRSNRGGGYDPARLAEVKLPVMVLLGEKDDLVGSADKLAATIPGARYVRVPGDHITALSTPAYSAAVLDFLHAIEG